MKTEKLGCIFEGTVNDINICRESGDKETGRSVMLLVKERSTARVMAGFPKLRQAAVCADEKGIGWLVPCHERRPIAGFYQGENLNEEARREVWRNSVAGCMAARVPWPVLYLMLRQGQMNLGEDRRIYFSWFLDLEELDPGVTEGDCANACAQILGELMERTKKKDRLCMELLRKKTERGAYTGFSELMLDLQYGYNHRHPSPLRKKYFSADEEQEHRFAKVLFAAAAALLAAALIFLVSQIIFGDIPILRMLGNGLDYIGSESLRQ